MNNQIIKSPLIMLGMAAMALQAGEVPVILNPASGQATTVKLISKDKKEGTVTLLMEGSDPKPLAEAVGQPVSGKYLTLKSENLSEYLIEFKSDKGPFFTALIKGTSSMSVPSGDAKWNNDPKNKGAYTFSDKKLTIKFPPN